MDSIHDIFESGEKISSNEDPHALFESGITSPAESRYSPDIKQYSALESAGKGIQQGTTLGFADELAALSGAAGAKYGGDERGFWDVYKDVLGSVRPEYKAAEEQNPISSFGGNLAGGLLVPAGLVGKAAAPGVGFAKQAGNIALTGARAGAVAGLGTSEADLTNGELGQAINDTAGGAGVGAGLGLLVGGSAGLIKGGGKLTKDVVGSFPIVQDIKDTITKTRAGEDFLNKVPEFSSALRNLARGFIDDLETFRRSSGGSRQKQLEDLEQKGVKINLNDIVDSLHSKLDNIEVLHPEEQADIDTFRKMLHNLSKEETVTETKLVAKNLPPTASPEELAQQNLAKRTAAAQTKDDIIRKNITDQIENETDEDVIAALKNKLSKFTDDTVYPPITTLEPTTEMNVASVNQGLNKAPLVAPITPAVEPLSSPLQKITNEVTTRGRTEATPTQVGEFLKSMGTAYEKSATPRGRQLAKEGKQALSTALEDEASKGNQSGLIDQFGAETDKFKGVADTQQLLGLPDYFSASEKGTKSKAINKLQNMIKHYHEGDSQSKQVIDEALDSLSQVYPKEAETLRNSIESASKSSYLARSLTEERKSFGLGAAAKSKALLGVHLTTKGVNAAENAAKNSSQALVDVGRNIYNASPASVQQMADIAAKTGSKFGQTTAKTLSSIINAPDAKRRAVLFTLMQQPDFREFAKHFTQE